MSWTYVLTTDIGKVRLEIQDTAALNALLSDEEIQVAIDTEGGTSVMGWAAHCCEIIARRYAQDFDWKTDGTQVQRIERAKHYATLAVDLRSRSSGSSFGTVQTVHADGYNANRNVDHAQSSSLEAPQSW